MIVVARGDKSGEDGIPMLLKIPRLFDLGVATASSDSVISSYQDWYDWLANKKLELVTLCGNDRLWFRSPHHICGFELDGRSWPTCLLYIVPFTPRYILRYPSDLAQMRGDLKVLWTRGEPERPCPHVHLNPLIEVVGQSNSVTFRRTLVFSFVTKLKLIQQQLLHSEGVIGKDCNEHINAAGLQVTLS
ncbi:unnamed protein product [Prunus armeniaca]|uniref:Uncharacterized protein n=1 Tax=Prunus armeniaca TaxID=36596 RepID=A0A6J5U1G9_PRUAR|nr:unnamed protein product [Prunus armeniaca]